MRRTAPMAGEIGRLGSVQSAKALSALPTDVILVIGADDPLGSEKGRSSKAASNSGRLSSHALS